LSAWEILRLLIGLPLVLLVPGWLWSLAAFPRSRPLGEDRVEPGALDWIERTALALALSIALASLGAFAWSGFLGWPLGTWGSLALVLLLSASGTGAWRWRVTRNQRPADAAN
jgi:uncharacterized membrane protein